MRTSAGGSNSTTGVGRTHVLPPQKLSSIAVSSEGKQPHCHHSSTKGPHASFCPSLAYSRGYLKIGGNTGGCRSSRRSEEVLLRIPPQVEGGSAEQHRRGRPPGLSRALASGRRVERKRIASKQKSHLPRGGSTAGGGSDERMSETGLGQERLFGEACSDRSDGIILLGEAVQL